ncbi:3-oxoacyl-[acyl-carrier-protein] reductase [Bacteroidetes/Chlorobi group bacterium MS-B_bin-24]|jgi:3-oxoacyl-[acyl-carrier protein] reductase|nr:MAG: 3-oxoacyl-[acyl-carrier-protein] reductase [Bacteroidetes/Chlorobi group bacterium MS-B_bin-24]
MKRFENKVVVVTGGCRGIGKAIVESFLAEGAFVWAWDYKLPDENEVFIENEKYRSRVRTVQVDVSSSESVNNATQKVLDESGRIDILVNNAGITRDNLLLRMTESDWDAVINTNLKGTFLCTKAILHSMMNQRYGRIINISSIVGEIGNAGQANYSASKAGVIGFTKSLAKEVASRNILVNAIAPGYVRTSMTEKLSPEQKETFLENIPLRREAEPEDIARVALFLASDDASYITGQVINVDGGLVM